MLILFGYMDILIFIKWGIDYKDKEYRAPDIKSFLMNIFLRFGDLPKTGVEGEDWIFFTDRATLEKMHFYILLLSLLCIIVMLVPKMILKYLQAKRKFRTNHNIENLGIGLINDNEDNNNNEEKINMNERFIDDQNNNNENNLNNQEPLFSDFMVASVIETIEFVLGTVSNTASYLRLWALSLAHSQLSVVFFSKCFGMANTQYSIVNGILLSLLFVIFALLTIGVLLFMDLMECALHTLRLHWVEFQNKFYKADGYQFRPFCFSQTINLNTEQFIQ